MGAVISQLSRVVVRWNFWAGCQALSFLWTCGHSITCRLFGGTQTPPPQRLAAPSTTDVEQLRELPRSSLPVDAFRHGACIAFEPCSNLCIYNFGAAACLQRASNFQDVFPHLRFTGASSGALVAAVMALNVDVCELFGQCVSLLDDINTRRGGWIGAYSKTIRTIVQKACHGRDIKTSLLDSRLRVNVTELSPFPKLHQLTAFASSREVEDAVLASCYIPVVWEDPIWLGDGIGPSLDGAVASFCQQADFVFGPYFSNLPDVGPKEEYPRQLVFQPVDRYDMIRLYEDGYNDCARWIENGCPSKSNERTTLVPVEGDVIRNLRVLLSEGVATFLEIVGFREKSV